MKTKVSENKSRLALVTGASSGIGKAICLKLAQEGFDLVLTSKTLSKLQQLEKELKKYEVDVKIITCDLSSVLEVEKFTNIVKKMGRNLDLIINAAGIYHKYDTVFYKIDLDKYMTQDIVETINVGMMAPAIIAKSLINKMEEGASIINISGTFESGAKGWLPYYLSKKGLENLTVGLFQEFEEKGVRVNCISPADTLTDSYKKFFPDYAKPEFCLDPLDIAEMVLWIHENRTLNGQVIEMRK